MYSSVYDIFLFRMAQVNEDSLDEDRRYIQEHFSKEAFEKLRTNEIKLCVKLKKNYEHLKSQGGQCIYEYINTYRQLYIKTKQPSLLRGSAP